MKRHVDQDDATFDAPAYTVRGYRGIAFWALGWQTEADEDTEWSGTESRTGLVTVVMVGDDRHHHVDPDDLAPIARTAYCGVCGQLGCTHDGVTR